MTNQEKNNRSLLLQFVLNSICTELNPVKTVEDMGYALKVELEDGTKQFMEIMLTDVDE